MGKSTVEEPIVISKLFKSQYSTCILAELTVELELFSNVPFTNVKSGPSV